MVGTGFETEGCDMEHADVLEMTYRSSGTYMDGLLSKAHSFEDEVSLLFSRTSYNALRAMTLTRHRTCRKPIRLLLRIGLWIKERIPSETKDLSYETLGSVVPRSGTETLDIQHFEDLGRIKDRCV